MKIKSLTLRVAIVVTIMTLFVLLATVLTVYNIAANNHKKDAAEESNYKLDLVVERLSKVQKTVELTARYSEPALKASIEDTTAVMDILTNIVETNSLVNCAALAYAPDRLPGRSYYMPIAANYGMVSHYFSDKEIHGEYIYDDWYIAPAQKDISFWTDPYYNTLDVPVVSYAIPIRNEQHELEAVLTLAVELTNLHKLLTFSNEVGPDSTSNSINIILDRNTTFITTRNKNLIMNETIFTLAESQNDTIFRHVGQEIVARRDGETVTNVNGEKSVITWRVLPNLQWTAMVVTPYTEVFARINSLTYTALLVALLATIAAIIILYFTVRRALRPFNRLKKATHLLGDGKYDTELPHKLTSRPDEIGDLSREFMRMEKAVKKNIDELEEERLRLKRSYEMLETLVHNVVSHLRLPINNMVGFNDALASMVTDCEEAQEIKEHSKEAIMSILKHFNQLNEMADLISLKAYDEGAMVDVSIEKFVGEAMKSAHQLEERFFLKVNGKYLDTRDMTIHTNTMVLENLLHQLIIEISKVSKTDEVDLQFRLDKDLNSMKIMVEAKAENPIPEEEKRDFFKQFANKKVNAYVTNDYLQLFICYRIAKLLGVKLYVDTPKNKQGNLFVIEIPKA